MKRYFFAVLVVGVLMENCSTAPNSSTRLELQPAAEQQKDVDSSAETSDEEVDELHDLVMLKSSTETPVAKTLDEVREDKRDERARSDKQNLFTEFSTSQDTPRDMAEYIFWTGDENSVTSAVKDFIKQGLMNQDEALGFLEQVRSYLDQMQQRYGPAITAGMKSATSGASTSATSKERVDSPAQVAAKPKGEIVVTSVNERASANSHDQGVGKLVNMFLKERNKKNEHTTQSSSLEEVLLSDETTLEEIVYQLSRILFTQSLHKDDKPKVEDSLQKFADFLEKESQEGRLSPQLQKKVLDLLLTSLFDTIMEQKTKSN